LPKSSATRPLEPARQLVVVARQVEDRLQGLAEEVVEARHADVAQEVLDGSRGIAPLVPTSWCRKIWGSATRMEKRPKARRRTMVSSLSRKVMGSFVPHFSSVKVCRLMK
jgi:hypothetical protein